METKTYQAPQVEIIAVSVEQGFAASFNGNVNDWGTQDEVKIEF